MGRFSFFPALLVAVIVTNVNHARAESVSFTDNFSSNSLMTSGHYAELGPGSRIANGVLSLTAGKLSRERPRLNILPAIGRNGELTFKAKWVSGDQAWLSIVADWRYHEMSPSVQMYALFEWNLVRFSGGTNATAPVAFEKGRWYQFTVTRRGDDITLSVDGVKRISTKIPGKENNVNAAATDSGYGGFQLSVDPDPGNAVIEIDDLVLTGDPSPVDLRVMARKFAIGTDADYRFTVIYEAGFEDWAAKAIEETIPYYRFLAGVMGVPPIQRRLGLVQARGAYYEPGNGYNSNGVIIQRGAHIDTRTSGWSGWGLNCHEAAHSWQHLYGMSWATEGQADLSCQLNWERITKIPLTTTAVLREPYATLMRKSGKETPCLLEGDGACPDGFRGGMPVSSPGPSKNIALAVVLYRLLGVEGYRQLSREALLLRHGMSTAEMETLLEKVSGRSFKAVLDGWVRAGASEFPYVEAARDADTDGLSDLDERLFGTDRFKADSDGDGAADFAEIRAGYSPLTPEPPARSGIFIDSLGGDWNRIPVPVTTVDPDDVAGMPELRDVRWISDSAARRYLVRLDLAEAIGATDGNRPDFTISLDLYSGGASGTVLYRVNLFLKDLAKNIVDMPRWPAMIDGNGVRMAVGSQDGHGFIEAEFPWSAVGGLNDLQLLVSASGSGGSDTIAAPIAPRSIVLPLDKKNYWRPPAIGAR